MNKKCTTLEVRGNKVYIVGDGGYIGRTFEFIYQEDMWILIKDTGSLFIGHLPCQEASPKGLYDFSWTSPNRKICVNCGEAIPDNIRFIAKMAQ
jgi:hypothetical protein